MAVFGASSSDSVFYKETTIVILMHTYVITCNLISNLAQIENAPWCQYVRPMTILQ